MESITKLRLSEKKIKELAVANFGEGIREITVQEKKGGMFNSAYEVSFYLGDDSELEEFILKVAVAPETEILTYEKNIMRTEVKVYLMLQGMDIPTPEIIKYDFSQTLIPCDYFFMTKLNGTPWNTLIKEISSENRKYLMEELGKYTAMIHSIHGNKFGYMKDEEGFLYDTWSEAFGSMMHHIINDGVHRNIKLPYEKILTAVEGRKNVLDEIEIAQLVDFDLWAGNIFLVTTEHGYEIEGIIDFERAFYGDPYADFVSSVLLYKDVEKEAAFLEGYKRQNGKELTFTGNDRIRLKLYRIYLNMIMVIETYRYNKAYAALIKFYCRWQIRKDLNSLI